MQALGLAWSSGSSHTRGVRGRGESALETNRGRVYFPCVSMCVRTGISWWVCLKMIAMIRSNRWGDGVEYSCVGLHVKLYMLLSKFCVVIILCRSHVEGIFSTQVMLFCGSFLPRLALQMVSSCSCLLCSRTFPHATLGL